MFNIRFYALTFFLFFAFNQAFAQNPPRRPSPYARPATKADRTVRSQFFYQPWASKHVVTLGASYGMGETNTGVQGSQLAKEKYTNTLFNLKYDYGLTADYSLGLSLDFGSEDTAYTYDQAWILAGFVAGDTTLKYSGMGDVILFGKGVHSMGMWSLIYGLNFGFSSTKTLASTTNQTGTRNSGGMSFEPYVGAQTLLSPGNKVGGTLSYKYKMERKSNFTSGTSTSEINFTDGNELTLKAFYEWYYKLWYFDPYLGYQMISQTKVKTTTTDTVIGARNDILFGLDTTYWLNRTFQLGGYYHGASKGSHKDTAVTAFEVEYLSYLEHTIGLWGRIMF